MSDGNHLKLIVGIFSNSVWRLVGKDALKLENPFEQLLGYLFGNPFEKISRVEDYSAGTASGTVGTRLLLLLKDDRENTSDGDDFEIILN